MLLKPLPWAAFGAGATGERQDWERTGIGLGLDWDQTGIRLRLDWDRSIALPFLWGTSQLQPP